MKKPRLPWLFFMIEFDTYPKIMPAMVADINETMVPPKTAFNPNSDKFLD